MKPLYAIPFALLVAACSGGDPKPDEQPATTPVAAEPTESTAPTPEPPASEPAGELQYHWREGRTRVYLPLDSAICQQDDAAQPSYAVDSLWKLDAGDSWEVVDVNSSGRWRIGCNAMLDMIDVFGFDLKPGTYAISASLDGIGEDAVFTVGPVQCDGDAPTATAGQVAACIPVSGTATYRMIAAPDGFDG